MAMIKWTGPNQKTLREALLKFYHSHQTLLRFVSDHFEYPLDDLPDVGTSRLDWAAELLRKAAAEGWIDKLYQTFCSIHDSDLRIVQLRQGLKDPALEIPIGGPEASNAIVRVELKEKLIEDPGSAHLVIAVFWQESSKQTIRIQPKLYYQDPNSREPKQAPLAKDDCSIELKAFPAILKELVKFTTSKLKGLFLGSGHPWKLTIALFVPVELLGRTLATWCGQDDNLLRSYPIVVGCSDRFNASIQDAAHLHNQLERGWQRFRVKVPDQPGSTLKNLEWLESARAKREPFERYSGFQCYGHWLKPDEQFLENWRELVKSGIPLALWMCEGKPHRATITAVFEQLIDGTRFELLDRISQIRDQQRKTSDYCVGVFYEDRNYVPDIPLPKEEQFFVWPGA